MSALNSAHCHSQSDAHHRVQSSLDSRTGQRALTEFLMYTQQKQPSQVVLENGSRVGVMGGADVQFSDLAATYYFGVAVFENGQVRHAFQTGSTPFIFMPQS